MTTPRWYAWGHLAPALLLALVGAGCGRAPSTTPPDPAPSVTNHNDGASLYAFDQTLTDQHGRSVALRDLAGHVVVASMVYASCTSICPRVTAAMQAIERALDARVRDDTRFLLVSLDPARDTPAAWRTFGLDHRLDETRWRLWSPTEEGVRDLAAILGVKYAPGTNGEIAHTAIIVVLDPLGVVVERQVGLGQSPDAIVAAVSRLQPAQKGGA